MTVTEKQITKDNRTVLIANAHTQSIDEGDGTVVATKHVENTKSSLNDGTQRLGLDRSSAQLHHVDKTGINGHLRNTGVALLGASASSLLLHRQT